jgi:hypothetical protein
LGSPEDGNPGLVQSEYFTSIGLVLYIVREIVVAKGGTVKVASTAQECTTFTVCIPRLRSVEGDNLERMESPMNSSTRETGQQSTLLEPLPDSSEAAAHGDICSRVFYGTLTQDAIERRSDQHERRRKTSKCGVLAREAPHGSGQLDPPRRNH